MEMEIVPEYFEGIKLNKFANFFEKFIKELKLPYEIFIGLNKTHVQLQIYKIVEKNNIVIDNDGTDSSFMLNIIFRLIITEEIIKTTKHKYNNSQNFDLHDIVLISNFSKIEAENKKCIKILKHNKVKIV